MSCNLQSVESYFCLHSNASSLMQTQAVLSLSSKSELLCFAAHVKDPIYLQQLAWVPQQAYKTHLHVVHACKVSSFPCAPLLSTFQCPVRSIAFNLTCHFVTVQHSLDLQHHQQCSLHDYGDCPPPPPPPPAPKESVSSICARANLQQTVMPAVFELLAG